MFSDILYAGLFVAVALDIVSKLYVIFAITRVAALRHQSDLCETSEQPVTVLIPIRGRDDGLYDNLRSICRQNYAEYQLILGVQDANDPAIEVIRRIIAEFPDLDVEFHGDDRIVELNPKISNLSNMYRRAKHAVIVILDSDMRVESHYLSTIIAPFQDPGVGAVTCLYKATPTNGGSSVLGSMFINEWFLPSVLVAHSLRKINFCFGATMAVRRDVFDAIGGFTRLGPYLADDYMLGKLVTEHGYRVHLSSYVVENMVVEHEFKGLFFHELRWARTIRAVQPLGYAFSFITYGTPLAILAGLFDEFTVDTDIFELGFLAVAVLLRIVLHSAACRTLGISRRPSVWLVPVRDMLGFLVWFAGFFGRDVTWKDQTFSVDSTGRLLAKG